MNGMMEYWSVGSEKHFWFLPLFHHLSIPLPSIVTLDFNSTPYALCALHFSSNPTQRLLADIGSIIDSVPGDLLNCLISFLDSPWNIFA